MAEAVAYAIADAIGEDFAFAYALGQTLQVVATVASVYTLSEDQRKARARQTAEYNASLKDRYLMVRSTTSPRTLVLGRQRVSGPMAYIGSYGTYREHLVFAVVLAAHQIDAVEAIYFDDEQVTLDGSGNVLAVNRRDLFTLQAASGTFTLSSAPNVATVAASVAYGTTVVSLGVSVAGSDVTVSGGTAGQSGTLTISYQPAQSPYVTSTNPIANESFSLDGSGNGSITLANTPVSGTLAVTVALGVAPDLTMVDQAGHWALVGNVVTVTGGTPSSTATASYQYTPATTSRARVRSYLGAPGQAADAAMVANLAGVWTSAHTLSGLAYLVVELDYDADAFPGGIPNVSAVVRGALCYDPRTGATAWSANPAILMRHVATHPLLGRMPTSMVNDTSIAVAANVCDQSTNYLVNGQTYTRPLYQAHLVVNANTRAKDALDDLAKAMAGDWTFNGGTLRVRAGAYVTPLQTLTDAWLAGGSAITVQTAAARTDLVNDISGRFLDEQHDWVEVQYPRVVSDTYQAADGADLPLDLPLNAVTFSGQAQQVVAARMRYVRMGLRFTVLCNMNAYPVEVFDTLYVTLARFGWVNKPFECVDVQYTIDGGILLSLKATDPSIWALGTSFSAPALMVNTLFPSPWQVPAVAGLAATSGSGQVLKMADGTQQTRILVAWTAITDQLVVADGGVEVRYGVAGTAEDQWQTVTAPRGQSQVYLAGNLRDGWVYRIKARAFNGLVKGQWCNPITHTFVAGTSQIPTGSIVANAATEVYVTTPSSAFTVTAQQHTPDGFAWQSQVTSVSFTPSASGKALVHFDGRGNYTNGGAIAASAVWSIQDAGGTYDGWKKLSGPLVAVGASASFAMTTTRNIDVTAGTTYTFALYAAKLQAADTFTVDNMELRVEIVKR